MKELYEGSCLCGAVEFSYTAPSLWSAHCHCTLCQRAHGAAVVTWVGVPEEQFQLRSDKTLKWHGSSEDAERGFCSECGSTLFFCSARWPGEMHIARANLFGEIDREPSAHVYWSGHVHWLTLGDELPREDSG